MMKNTTTLLLFFAISMFLAGCDKPAPTELVNDFGDNNLLEYEVLNPDLNEHYASMGMDTTGITKDLNELRNLISISGVKITRQNYTIEYCLAQAFFFDWEQPVYYSNARLLGFKTMIPGVVKFNGQAARIVPYRVRFRDRGEVQDTLLGNKYILHRNKYGQGDPFWFDYGAPVSFEYQPFSGNPISFSIPTMRYITGAVQLHGNSSEENLEATLQWNKSDGQKVFVVVGLVRNGNISSLPVYRFTVREKNNLFIPKRFFSELPLQNFEKLVFTFIKSYEKMERNGESNLFVSSQNIHSIIIDIP